MYVVFWGEFVVWWELELVLGIICDLGVVWWWWGVFYWGVGLCFEEKKGLYGDD